ncbi:MAG: hypothetical protein KIT58_14015 [Planctomycetota bacterium]|nr:hypothetical protein [Planctomycetota bacterium]
MFTTQDPVLRDVHDRTGQVDGVQIKSIQVQNEDLLRHYVEAAPQTVLSVDQLGNFLMGFGVLAMGYMLQADLSPALQAMKGALGARAFAGLLALLAWGLTVALLLAFVRTYIFRVLAGRAVHAEGGNEDRIGEVVEVPEELSWRRFNAAQPTFEAFLKDSYRRQDRQSPEQLLYARFSYLRFMTLRKLAEMDRMRRLLGQALVSGVAF